jgi:hypothetical protein
MKVRPVSVGIGRKCQGSPDASTWRNSEHVNAQSRTLWFQEEICAPIGDAGRRKAREGGLVTPMNPIAGTGQFAPNLGAFDRIVLNDVPQTPLPHRGTSVEIITIQISLDTKRSSWRCGYCETSSPFALRGVTVVSREVHEIAPVENDHVRVQHINRIECPGTRREQLTPFAQLCPKRALRRASVSKTCRRGTRGTASCQKTGNDHRRSTHPLARELHWHNAAEAAACKSCFVTSPLTRHELAIDANRTRSRTACGTLGHSHCILAA